MNDRNQRGGGGENKRKIYLKLEMVQKLSIHISLGKIKKKILKMHIDSIIEQDVYRMLYSKTEFLIKNTKIKINKSGTNSLKYA